MRPRVLRAAVTAFTASGSPCLMKPSSSHSNGRCVVMATRPPFTSHVILSPGPTSSASHTSFGIVVWRLLVMVEVGIVLGSLRILQHVRRRCGGRGYSEGRCGRGFIENGYKLRYFAVERDGETYLRAEAPRHPAEFYCTHVRLRNPRRFGERSEE